MKPRIDQLAAVAGVLFFLWAVSSKTILAQPKPDDPRVELRTLENTIQANPVTGTVDPSKLYITESRANAFVIVDVYNRVQIGGWLKVIGPKVEGASAISVPAAEWFPPEKTRIESTHEPHVAKQDDGSWQITFTAP